MLLLPDFVSITYHHDCRKWHDGDGITSITYVINWAGCTIAYEIDTYGGWCQYVID